MNVGDRFGNWTAISEPFKGDRRKEVIVRCDCGAERSVRMDVLQSGGSRSCGACKRIQPGDRFGRWSVVGNPFNKGPLQRVRVKCDCGMEKDVLVNSLRKGDSRSCGCLHRDQHRKRFTTHGSTDTRLYGIWQSMLRRCRDREFKDYGDRGITVCAEWLDFVSFQEWAEGAGYNDRLTIDRIDSEKGYCPENCRFVTRLVQSQNRRKHSNNTSGYIGVYRNRHRWQAQASHLGRQIYLGRYDDPAEAARVRDAYVRKHYESPTLNFPEEVKA